MHFERDHALMTDGEFLTLQETLKDIELRIHFWGGEGRGRKSLLNEARNTFLVTREL